jgi:hypothetical protein
MYQLKLTFACELDAPALAELFTPAVIDDLLDLQAQVSIGLLDMTIERAQTVKVLNAANIPLIAWLLLPREQGYWSNIENAEQTVSRYQEFKEWTRLHDLHWSGVALDIEPSISNFQGLLRDRWVYVAGLLERPNTNTTLQHAEFKYSQLVRSMRNDGYYVYSYNVPLILDERRAGSSLLRRTLGLVDVGADRDMFMLYSSLLGKLGSGLLRSYGHESEMIGIGSTGGGVDLGELLSLPPLTWEELCQDLRTAMKWTGDIFLGYLRRLKTRDWDEVAPKGARGTRIVNLERALLRAVLRLSAHSRGFEWLLIHSFRTVAGHSGSLPHLENGREDYSR